jgi:hypothetical protein
MEHYEYEITTHSGDTFSRLTYFCSEGGECSLEEVPSGEPQILVDLLNERGGNGWELVQLLFGKDGVMAFWKRRSIAG